MGPGFSGDRVFRNGLELSPVSPSSHITSPPSTLPSPSLAGGPGGGGGGPHARHGGSGQRPASSLNSHLKTPPTLPSLAFAAVSRGLACPVCRETPHTIHYAAVLLLLQVALNPPGTGTPGGFNFVGDLEVFCASVRTASRCQPTTPTPPPRLVAMPLVYSSASRGTVTLAEYAAFAGNFNQVSKPYLDKVWLPMVAAYACA